MLSTIAYIREAECIGCIKCIKACSDQAILGARKQMHTIITDLCTGCEDCIAACPVDCIEMIVKPTVTQSIPVIPSIARDLPLQQQNSSALSKKETIAAAMQRTLARRAWTQGESHDSTKMPRDI